jgi:hypothetical protein
MRHLRKLLAAVALIGRLVALATSVTLTATSLWLVGHFAGEPADPVTPHA